VILEELHVYQLAMDIGEKAWKIANDWEYFTRNTLGSQLIRAADSIAANLSEGYGRFYYKENKQFCYYSRGSLCELKTWLIKAHTRALIKDSDFEKLLDEINLFNKKLIKYIGTIGKNHIQSSNDL
jgi:four helix bundle protein